MIEGAVGGSTTESASNSTDLNTHYVCTVATARSTLNLPTDTPLWWLEFAAGTWKWLPMIGIAVGGVVALLLCYCCVRRVLCPKRRRYWDDDRSRHRDERRRPPSWRDSFRHQAWPPRGPRRFETPAPPRRPEYDDDERSVDDFSDEAPHRLEPIRRPPPREGRTWAGSAEPRARKPRPEDKPTRPRRAPPPERAESESESAQGAVGASCRA